MKIDCDENGAPKMDFGIAKKYYNEACEHIPEGIGLILSPFAIDEFSFQKSAVSEDDAVNQAENEFWAGTGTHGMMFGSTKASSSSSLEMATKPDEKITFKILDQVSRYFNKQIKIMNLPYYFKQKFLDQSIFNKDEVCNRYLKASQYGVSGAKLCYAASLDMSPSDVIGMAYLENEILEITDKMFTSPLISSNTMSPDKNDGVGKPTNKSKGENVTDSGEQTQEDDENNR
jgi:hypothetical protein